MDYHAVLNIILIVILLVSLWQSNTDKREHKKQKEEMLAKLPAPITDLISLSEEEWRVMKTAIDFQINDENHTAWMSIAVGPDDLRRKYAFKVTK